MKQNRVKESGIQQDTTSWDILRKIYYNKGQKGRKGNIQISYNSVHQNSQQRTKEYSRGINIYVYIYREREREREDEKHNER